MPVDFDWQAALQLGEEHQVSSLLDYGLLHTEELTVPQEVKGTLENQLYTAYTLDLYQKGAIEHISGVFNRNGIRHMFLKGSVLKFVYPKSEMRHMGDLDILVDMEQAEKITALMREMGFEEQYQTPHEWSWCKSDIIHVELHKLPIDPDNRLFADYYRDVWTRTIPTGEKTPYSYALSDEDLLIYMFVHFTKHVYVQGIGLQHVLDFWVLRHARPQMDMTYVRAELQKLRLLTFYENIETMLGVWFSDEQPNEVTEFLTQKIFFDGLYGKKQNYASYYAYHVMSGNVDGQKPRSRLYRCWRILFPDYHSMCRPYPILLQKPVLLPIFWVFRPFDILFRRRQGIKQRIRYSRLITKENVASQRALLQKIGLDPEEP